MELYNLYRIYRRWLHIEDTRRIDIVLAVALTRKMSGTPLWLIIVGPSGDWKSEQLAAIDGQESVVLSRITENTLISGYGGNEYDLIPKLDGKILIIPDMSSMLKLHPNIKAEVWAQMRELYDGKISRKTGSMKEIKEYKGFRVTLLAGSTPAIDAQILIYQELGTRELLWRTGETNRLKLMDKVWKNERFETVMREQLNKATHEFLDGREIKNIKIPKKVEEYLKYKASFLSLMRATVQADSYTGDIIAAVTPEEPTRVLKQLKRIFIALKSLGKNYNSNKALDIIDHVVSSSCDPIRLRLYHILQQKKEKVSLSELANEIKIGKNPIKIQLQMMWNMEMVEKEEIMGGYNGEKVIETKWKLEDKWR